VIDPTAIEPMTATSHTAASGADPCRPPAAEILRNEANHYLNHAAEDCDEAARRLHWLANGERLEHGLEPDQWLSPAQCDRLLRLAALAKLVAADARAVLEEVAPG
jgi:hypothetical protein